MNLYFVEFEIPTFSIGTIIEAKNKKEANKIGAFALKNDGYAPEAIKNEINTRTIKVDRIYKSHIYKSHC